MELIIRDKLKDELINDIWALFETEEKKEERKKRNIMKELLKIEQLEISGHVLNKKKKKVIMSLKQ